MKNLTRLAGLDSVIEGMNLEQRELAAQGKALHRDLFGDESQETGEGGEMRILAAHDVIINRPESKATQGPQASSPEPTQEHPAKSLAAKLGPYLLAALLGAGGGAGAMLPSLLNRKPENPPAASDTDTTRRVEFEKWVPEE